MPEVTATCPHCQKRVKLKSEKMLGKKINCRNCESPFVLKADGPKKSKTSRKKPSADFESDFDDAYDSSQIRARRLRKRKGGSSTKSKPEESSSKKKSSKDGDPKLPLPLLIGGSVLGMCLMVGLAYFIFSKGSALNPGGAANDKAVVPAKFVKFEPEVGDFGCEYPEGWTEKSGGGQGGVQSWAKFISPDESTTISVRGNMTGSALGGAGLAMSQGAEDEIEPPVVDIHRLMEQKFSDDYPNYEEIGNFQLFKSKMGDTCSSIFTTKSFLGGKQKGLRVTFLTGRVQFNLICLCDEGLFDKMRPAFDQVVKTIHEK
ncbi:hypothetical protein [Gimesia fumaroli]|uniref:Zinc finger/thioredoxin putative domain-containing protein n=1 Tax=Gimesia fumaroli TaxID=2527976 RepID=A0A518IC25_9PLAN|nr:hypothetical protein [Gimesia fumaroli]QDV50634.1 hypothetical protein Enr17x_26750 [Gimesia fumaroli]